MDLITIFYLYLALYIVIFLHELGHLPEKIKIKFGLIPKAAAMSANNQFGGLLVNVLIFYGIYYLQPTNILLLYIGLVSWIHFILYTALGGIIPEPKISEVNIATYIFDDIPNKYSLISLSVSVISFIMLKSYYIPILRGLF